MTWTPFVRVLAALVCSAGIASVQPALAQGVQIVPVKATGFGMDEPAAVRSAVLSAVGQINGESVASRVKLSVRSSETSGGQRETRRESTEDLAVATQGVVKSYRVLAVDNDAQMGGVRATVEVRVAAVEQSPQLKRLRLAVVHGGRAMPGVAAELARDAEAFDASFRESLNQALVATRKFAMLDRSGSGVAEREFALIRSGATAIEERARMHRAAAADLLVVPVMQRFGPDPRQRPSLLPAATASPDAATEQRWRAAVQVSVLDYSSGQIKYGTTVSGSRRAGGDGALALAQQLAAEAAAQILEHSFPAEVIGIDGSRLTLSTGGGAFAVGDPVQLFARGKALTDPHTGEFMGHDEKPMGHAVIEQSNTRFSVARANAATEAQVKGLRSAQIVVRRAAVEMALGPAARSPAAGAGKSTLASDKDW